MDHNEFPPLSDLRQTIHDLTLQKRSSGLSPPDETVLAKLESQEACTFEFNNE